MSEIKTTTGIVHEGPSISIPAKDIHFIQTGIKTEEGELLASMSMKRSNNSEHTESA